MTLKSLKITSIISMDKMNSRKEVRGMDMEILSDVPMLSVTDIKRSPMEGFNKAKDENTGVYITNRDKAVGVMLTREQYEKLVKKARK